MSESAPTIPMNASAAPAGTASVGRVSPEPSDEEVVAIMAAVEALWPRTVVAVHTAPERRSTWRFSGRWWSRPVPARRGRPYR
jgi:hypothetical protein